MARKARKKGLLKRLLTAVLVIIVLVLVGGYFYLDRFAERMVERGASDQLGVSTELAGLRIGLLSGDLDLNGLNVANPQGFGEKSLMAMESGHVNLRVSTLFSETIEVPELRLAGLELHILRQGTKLNLSPVLERLKEMAAAEPAADPKQVIVRRLTVKDVSVHLRLGEMLGASGNRDIALPDLELEDVGAEGSGQRIAGELLQRVLRATLAALAEQPNIPAPVRGLLGSAENLKDQLRDRARSVIEEQKEKATERFRDMIGGKKDNNASDTKDTDKDGGG